jgi:hypothetical protein
MTRRNTKHILTQAKKQREDELSKVLAAAQAEYESVYQSETAPPEELGRRGSELATANTRLHDAQEAMEEWRSLGKRNRKKLGRQVDWTATRAGTPDLRVNRDALTEAKAARKASRKSRVGIDWLYEGAMVTHRGETGVMIVTQIAGNTVECLNGTAPQWFRNMSLRPAEWMMED